METTHIIIDKNFLFLFKKSPNYTMNISSYDIAQNYKLIKEINMATEYLDYYMNSVCYYNNNFYIFGGLLNDELRSLKYMTIINSDFKNILVLKSNSIEIPKKRLFIDNNNSVIINDIIYMAGGCLDDSDIIDQDNITCKKSVFNDFWSYDIKNKNWNCISNDIFREFNDELCDYIEITHKNNNIFFIGKFIGNNIFIYNVQNNSFNQIKLKFTFLFNMEHYVQKSFIFNENIFFIMRNKNFVSVLKLNLCSYMFEMYKLCENIFNDILLSNNNENIFIVERKLEKDILSLRFDNNLFDMVINKININKQYFNFKDYDMLCKSLKKKLNII